jgi:hypothetical protein
MDVCLVAGSRIEEDRLFLQQRSEAMQLKLKEPV